MNFNDDGYAAMLLTMALSPDREEYARPYTVQEFRRLEAAVRKSELRRPGALLTSDISALMIYLGLTEEEGYRAYTLLHRTVPLSYALESLARQGIDVVTCYDADYPARLRRKLDAAAPPFFYRCGNPALLNGPAVAVVGIQGIKTDNQVREVLDRLVRDAARCGYTVITGGELGVSRVAAKLAGDCGGALLDVLGGGMAEHVHADGIAELIATDRAAAVSLVHPETLFTIPHAAARNRVLFSLADAVFVFNTDGRRGEGEILQSRCCDWVYAWEGSPQCRALIARGAIPMSSVKNTPFEDMSRHWNSSNAEQLNMFDLL
ncbi:MAG: DNA-processing protein DprA [Clostridia bacterium]|nr:DNA-processing protein DprA [Clostridia bacterium]